jgi:hypothetical protein
VQIMLMDPAFLIVDQTLDAMDRETQALQHCTIACSMVSVRDSIPHGNVSRTAWYLRLHLCARDSSGTQSASS